MFKETERELSVIAYDVQGRRKEEEEGLTFRTGFKGTKVIKYVSGGSQTMTVRFLYEIVAIDCV